MINCFRLPCKLARQMAYFSFYPPEKNGKKTKKGIFFVCPDLEDWPALKNMEIGVPRMVLEGVINPVP
jgi:hypothetical protein